MSPRRARRVLVPVDLGGSPQLDHLRPPLRPPPSPELVQALVAHYRDERRPGPDVPLEVGFFHGGRPDPALVAAVAPHAWRLAAAPVDLVRAEVEAWRARGLQAVEVELHTLDEDVLRGIEAGHGAAGALALIRGLRALGLRVGAVLRPGLPGASHQGALDDARRLAGLEDPGLRVDFVRLYPALALQGSRLATWAAQGRWTPMRLSEAVTTCLGMVEIFEAQGVEVARVGLQPGPDLPVPAVAGPVHPDLRGLVQARRFRARLAAALVGVPPGAHVQLAVHQGDLSWARGPGNANVRALRAARRLGALELRPDPHLRRGEVARVG